MDAASRRFRAIRRLPPRERVAAFAHALPAADASEKVAITEALLEIASWDDAAAAGGLRRARAAEEARAARLEAVRVIAGRWCEVPRQLRALALAACRGAWGESLDGIDPLALPGGARSIPELAIDSAAPSLIAGLPRILGSEDPQAVGLAAQALLSLALRIGPERPEPELFSLDSRAPALRPIADAAALPWKPSDVLALHRALCEALRSFEPHRRKEVLLASLILLERPPRPGHASGPLAALGASANDPACETLRTAFRRARAPVARHRAWLWLREPGVAGACMERVARAPSLLDHAIVLRAGHLALAPARARHARLIQVATRPAPADQVPPGVLGAGRRLHPEGPVPDRAALAHLDVTARRQAARLVSLLSSDATGRALALDPFLTDPDAIARLSALIALPPGEPARDFCFDASAPLAAIAAGRATACGIAESGRLRAGDSSRRRFAASLVRSPYARVRRIGREEFDRLSPGSAAPLRRMAARRAHAADPSGFVDWVRDTVRTGPPKHGVDALMTARRIGTVADIEPLLLAVVRDSLASDGIDPRVTATAVACLGDIPAPRTVGVLTECLGRHPDARVRANAADALGRCRPFEPRDGVLADRIEDAHHRVRGSVLRTLLTPWPETKPGMPDARAAQVLGKMLLDERPEYRLAAVWVVQRSLTPAIQGALGRHWRDLEGVVRWAANGDSDARIRARAALIVHRLDAAIEGLGPRRPAGVVA